MMAKVVRLCIIAVVNSTCKRFDSLHVVGVSGLTPRMRTGPPRRPRQVECPQIRPQESDPGAGLACVIFEFVDVMVFFHRQPDIVQTMDQAMLAMGVDVEFDHNAI